MWLILLGMKHASQNGNILFMILIAIALIGALTAVIQSSSTSDGANIDDEALIIRTTEVQRYAAELERAVLFIMQNGHSESDIRFAHPKAHSDYGDLAADTTPSNQVFHKNGGGAAYRGAPSGINDGSAWEFYGGTAMPAVGSNKADLVAVLPNVSDAFCTRINDLNNQNGTPTDTGGSLASGASAGSCVSMGAAGRFDSAQQFYTTPNTADEATFAQDSVTSAAHTALQGCVKCDADAKNHFYHVLMAR